MHLKKRSTGFRRLTRFRDRPKLLSFAEQQTFDFCLYGSRAHRDVGVRATRVWCSKETASLSWCISLVQAELGKGGQANYRQRATFPHALDSSSASLAPANTSPTAFVFFIRSAGRSPADPNLGPVVSGAPGRLPTPIKFNFRFVIGQEESLVFE